MINILHNVYKLKDNILKSYEYIILFGNMEHAWTCNKDDLQGLWGKAIRNSKTISYGDVSLLHNGKLVRSVHNANIPILRKIEYKCIYKKYCNE
jgi:hypothetical protein